MPAKAWMCGGGRFCGGGAMARGAAPASLRAKRALRLHLSAGLRPLAWRGRGAGVRAERLQAVLLRVRRLRIDAVLPQSDNGVTQRSYRHENVMFVEFPLQPTQDKLTKGQKLVPLS